MTIHNFFFFSFKEVTFKRKKIDLKCSGRNFVGFSDEWFGLVTTLHTVLLDCVSRHFLVSEFHSNENQNPSQRLIKLFLGVNTQFFS